MGGYVHVRQLVATIFLLVWSVRLAGFLFFRILRTGHDDRFNEMRSKFFSFLGFWIFQMIWVWTVSLPVTLLNSPNITQYDQVKFGTGRDIGGIILFAVGFFMEVVADAQKYVFRNSHDRSAVCDGGLFAVSRHPNYFGEIILHFGKQNWHSSRKRKQVLTYLCRHLYDCSVARRRWICQKRSIQGAVCFYCRTILHYLSPHVPFWYALVGETKVKGPI